jgi:ABC-type uncharacterized transport system permease subunit
VPDIVIHALASAGYAGLAWHFWNTRWRAAGARAGGLAAWERSGLAALLALHGWLLYADLFLAEALRFGFAHALSITLWLGVAIYWVESLFLRLDGFEPLVLPIAAAAAPLPAFFPGRVAVQYAGSPEFALHVALGMLASGVLIIAILHVALMVFLERNLHRPGRAALQQLAAFPPLLTLERLLFRMIAVAFALFTLTLGMGIAFSESIHGRAFRFDHKTLFSVLTWITLAVLLFGRYAWGWRGRTALRWAMAGFAFLMLAYVGKSFVLEVILGRS